MKDIIIRTLKGSFGLLPQSIKTQLRKQSSLRQWYGDKLRKSSIAYEVPSLKKTRARHKINLAFQQQVLRGKQKVALNDPSKIDVVIIGSEEISITLQSIECVSELLGTVWISDSRYFQHDSSSPSRITPCLYGGNGDSSVASRVLVIAAGAMLCKELALRVLAYGGEGDLCYFDSFTVDEKRKVIDYHLLPDWNPDLLISSAYIDTAILLNSSNSLVYLDRFVRHGITPTLLHLYFSVADIDIVHQPFYLTVKNLRLINNVNSVLKELPDSVTVTDTVPDVLKVQWSVPSQPLVSLVIPTFNGKELVKMCIESILENTTYQNYEILLVDNNSDDPECLRYFQELDKYEKITLLHYPHPFNYSAINNFAVKHAKGEVIGLINNDIEVITPQWLDYMVGHAMRDDIGCVGAKLLYPDDRIQHAGVVLGYGGGAGHAHKYFPRYHPGYMNRLIATQNYSAVTAACLLIKKSKYEEVGGLDEVNLEVAFNDVDFCLRVLETGVRNLYCAEAELYHHESVSRGLDITVEKAARFNRELSYLQSKWQKYIDHDPAYNPNLTLKRENFSIKEASEY